MNGKEMSLNKDIKVGDRIERTLKDSYSHLEEEYIDFESLTAINFNCYS